MAWGEVKIMDQRKSFIKECQEKILSFAEICRQYEISRKTGYKWLKRYEKDGVSGLKNLSKAPKNQVGATDPSMIKKILDIKHLRSKWGPKKILVELKKHNPDLEYPSKTTIGNILDKNGLVMRRKYKKRLAKVNTPFIEAVDSNDIWCMDFKGWSMTKDGVKYDPFTLTDRKTRFLLRCLKLQENDTNHVWAVLEMAFREYGLPRYLRSDNGSPFAANTPGRLSRLGVKLIKAGVMPLLIEPGKPQQNGQHERMHRTMKEEGIIPHVLTLNEQELKLREFRDYYNFQRPHEAIDQQYPGDLYTPSPRIWSGKLNPMEYSADYKVGKVGSCGKMSWKGTNVFISRSLENEYVGVKKNEENKFEVYFGPIILGILVDNKLEFERNPSRKKTVKRVEKNGI